MATNLIESKLTTQKYITYFIASYKKQPNIKDVENDKILEYVCEDLHSGMAIDLSGYMHTIYNLKKKIDNLKLYEQTTHISSKLENKIIEVCNEFKNNDNYQILKIILPKGKIKYYEKDCNKIRQIANSILDVNYNVKEYLK